MKKKPQDEQLLALIAGRTTNEQIESIKRHGNHGLAPTLRATLLRGLGITKSKPVAKNLIIFGCYVPFSNPLLIRNYIKLLDLLQIEYTYLNKEYCCGLPMLLSTTGVEHEKAIKAGIEFMQMNRDMAQQQGAENMVYCCVGCAHSAKGYFVDEPAHHMYYFDLLIDKLEKKTLRIAPTVMGYYEGCQVRYKKLFPEVSLGWERCRQMLNGIDGLKMVDLPHKICCRDYPERIVKTAKKQNLNTILCSCNACYTRLSTAAQGSIQVKYLTDVLLEALDNR